MLIFCDSFDDRPIASIGDRYTASGGGHAYNLSADSGIYAGRTGNGLGLSSGILGVHDYAQYHFTSRQSVYIGAAWNAQVYTALGSLRYEGTPQIYLQLNSDLTISVIRYDGGANTVLAVSTRTVPSGFYYVELYGKIDPSAGAYELRVDGTRWLSASGVNTSSTGDSLCNQVRLTNTNAIDGNVATVDDFYIADTDPDDGNAAIVGFAGPVKIALQSVTGAGASTEWTPLSGANYTNVDDGAATGKDDDTSYVATLTNGNVDLYTVSAFEAVQPTVKAVAVHQWMKKMDGTVRNVTPVAYVSGAEYTGHETALGASYDRVFHAFERNPATNLPWTRAQVAAAQFGVALAE